MDDDDDDFELISEQEFVDELAHMEQPAATLAAALGMLQVRFRDRLVEDETHDCPIDHAVMEALVQAKLRMAESVMWLKTAIATKIDVEPPFDIQAPADHDPEKVN